MHIHGIMTAKLNRMLFSVVALLYVFLLTGCASTSESPTVDTPSTSDSPDEATDTGGAVAFSQEAAYLVHCQVEQLQARSNNQRNSGITSFSAVVISPEGHILIPYTIAPDSPNRITAWIGEDRYIARPLKVDTNIGMTILKVEPAEPLTPVDLESVAALELGERAYTLLSTDDKSEFARFVFEAFCQGVVEGFYRQYSIGPLPSMARGAPLYNPRGQLVGLVNSADAWVLSDIKPSIQELLEEVSSEKSTEKVDASKSWFGALMSPINRDYARANDLPRAALWLIHVYKGSPAHKAGFRNGDLLVELNGSPLRMSDQRTYQYFNQALRPRIGKSFSAVVLRDGERIEGTAKFTRTPEPATLLAKDIGITVSDMHEVLQIRLNLFERKGVLVTTVHRGSPAGTGRQFGSSLLRSRDVITSLYGHPTPNIKAFGEALNKIRAEKPESVVVEFTRGPTTGIEALNMRIGQSQPNS